MTSYRLSIVTFTERLANAVRNSYASQVTIQSYVYKRATAYTICLARYMLSPVRPSVTRMDQSKTVEDRIMKFLPYGSL